MTAVLKRILFTLGFVFVAAYAFGRWIATGESWLDTLEAFGDWCGVPL